MSYLAGLAGQRDEAGRPLVVRNGFHAERTIATSAGPVQVKAPRVNDKRIDAATGERKRFSSAILPPWARKTPKISEVLPLLYLHGLSTRRLRAGPGAVHGFHGRTVAGHRKPP
jgi:putative transposase